VTQALIDTSVISNFARVRIEPLIAVVVPQCTTTDEVLAELQSGISLGHLPLECDLQWLSVVTLSEAERILFNEFSRQGLGPGESSCIAVAVTRRCSVFTDDKAARSLAQSLQLPVSGTLGILVSLELISEMVSQQNPNACQMHEADVVFNLILIAHCNRSATSCSGVQPSIAAC
jgi:predicted nucleic acid-binding protein